MRENVELIKKINDLRDKVKKITSGDISKKGNGAYNTGSS